MLAGPRRRPGTRRPGLRLEHRGGVQALVIQRIERPQPIEIMRKEPRVPEQVVETSSDDAGDIPRACQAAPLPGCREDGVSRRPAPGDDLGGPEAVLLEESPEIREGEQAWVQIGMADSRVGDAADETPLRFQHPPDLA